MRLLFIVLLQLTCTIQLQLASNCKGTLQISRRSQKQKEVKTRVEKRPERLAHSDAR